MPVYVSLDATSTSEHPSQGLMLLYTAWLNQNTGFPLKKFKKRRYIANGFAYTRRNSRFYFTSILSANRQESDGS